MADPKVIYEDGRYYAVVPNASWSGMPDPDSPESWLSDDVTGNPEIDLRIWIRENMGKVASKTTTKGGFPAVQLTGLGSYKGPVGFGEAGGPQPGQYPGAMSASQAHDNYNDAQAYGISMFGPGTEGVKWWVDLDEKSKPYVKAIQPGAPKPERDERIVGSQLLPGTDKIKFQYADGNWSPAYERTKKEKEEEPGVGSDTYSEAVWEAIRMQVAERPVEGGPPVFDPGYVLAVDTDPSSKTFQKWVVRTTSSMSAAEVAHARKMSDDQLAMTQTKLDLDRIQANINRGMPFGGVSEQAQPIKDAYGNIIQYAIQEYDAAGNLSTRYVDAPEPTVMAQPDPAAQVVSTEQGMYQYTDNEWSPLGMSERPATLEMQGGMMWMRDINGGLSPVNNVLERMIEQKIIEGDWDAALQWDDFRNRPSPQEHLQAMLDYARTPADQMLLSAIARGYEQGAVPPNAGELGRVGPVPAEQRQAWERYQRSVTGTGSEMSEMQEFLVQESEARNALEEERIAQDDQRWQGLSDTITAVQEDSQAQMTAIQDSIATSFNAIADSVIGEAMGMEKLPISSSAASGSSAAGSLDIAGASSAAGVSSIAGRVADPTQRPSYAGEDVGTIDRDVKLLEIIESMMDTGEWQSIDTVGQKQWWMSQLTQMSTGHASDVISRSEVIEAIRGMGSNPGSYAAHDPLAMQAFMRDWNRGDLTDPDHFWRTFQPGVDKPMGPTPEEFQVQEEARLLDESDPMVMGYRLDDAGKPVQTGFMRTSELEADANTFTGSGIRAHVEQEKERVAQEKTARATEKEARATTAREAREARALTEQQRAELPVYTVSGAHRKPDVTPLPLSLFSAAGEEGALISDPSQMPPQGTAGVGSDFRKANPTTWDLPSNIRRSIGEELGAGTFAGQLTGAGQDKEAIKMAQYAGVSPQNLNWDWEGAEGGIVHGPTVALLGEKEPEVVIPLSKLPKMAEGGIVFSSAEQQPVGIQELLASRSPRPLGGRLLHQAGMTLPSAQAWRNLTSDEQEIYSDLGARAGITPGYMQSELASARPSGGRGAGQATMLPLATRRIFR